jgi:regulator of protease activity HflC (stomatin/prohibitin superfamily)
VFGLAILILLITVLASIRELAPNEQLLVKDPAGYWVKNGPFRGVVINVYSKETREAVLLQPENYAVVKDTLSGQLRDVNGPHLLFLGAYDELVGIRLKYVLHEDQYALVKNELTGQPRMEVGPSLLHPGIYDKVVRVSEKIILQKDEYIRLVDGISGSERVVRGPQTFVPTTEETSRNGTERCLFLDTDLAVLVLNRTTGAQHLVTDSGAFAPGPYEEILELRPLIHVLPHEAIIVRDAGGQLTVYSGSDGKDATGMSLFLPPYCEVMEMTWSDYSLPPDDVAQKAQVSKIDMRARHIFFEYGVRTSDNVKLNLEGTIFWQVKNVSKMIFATPDPEGDVWHHARSALIEAISNTTLADFMSGFNGIVMESFGRQAKDGFYVDRGVELQSMELTSFDCADSDTAKILQKIVQETTNRINRLTAQRSENDVNAAALTADITLERQRTDLIKTRAENERLQAQMHGEATGMEIMKGAATFIGGLNESVPDVESRVELYKLQKELEGRNKDTLNLASGTAHLFLSPQDLNLRLDTRSPAVTTPEL